MTSTDATLNFGNYDFTNLKTFVKTYFLPNATHTEQRINFLAQNFYKTLSGFYETIRGKAIIDLVTICTDESDKIKELEKVIEETNYEDDYLFDFLDEIIFVNLDLPPFMEELSVTYMNLMETIQESNIKEKLATAFIKDKTQF